jgi:hypothetical protein
MTMRPLIFLALALGVSACGPAAEKPADHGAHGSMAATPKADSPSLALTPAQAGVAQTVALNQPITVALPVKLADNQAWVSGSKMADLGPFMFHGLEEQPGAGPGGTDLIVFTYMAHEPGDGALKFARVPAGVAVIGAGAKPEAAVETVEFAIQAK